MARMTICSFLKTSFNFKIGWTPLHLAAFHGHEGTAKILLEHGPNIDLQDQVLLFFFQFFQFFIWLVIVVIWEIFFF